MHSEATNRITKSQKSAVGQHSCAPNGVSPVWLVNGVEPMATEEPYEGNLNVRSCGEGAR